MGGGRGGGHGMSQRELQLEPRVRTGDIYGPYNSLFCLNPCVDMIRLLKNPHRPQPHIFIVHETQRAIREGGRRAARLGGRDEHYQHHKI